MLNLPVSFNINAHSLVKFSMTNLEELWLNSSNNFFRKIKNALETLSLLHYTSQNWEVEHVIVCECDFLIK